MNLSHFLFLSSPSSFTVGKAVVYMVMLITGLVFGTSRAGAQYQVKGTVYDSSRQYRIEAVTVQSSAGRVTTSDSMGRYVIDVSLKDSVWFSYLGKSTPRYAVTKMEDIHRFDISLLLKSNVMEEVKIRNRSYRMDSIQNRIDYAKVFDYRKVSVESVTSIGPMGAGFDLQELIRLFQFKKNRSMLKFQERLLEQEQEKYITHRFSKGLIMQLTPLKLGEELDRFMLLYRPNYTFASTASDYDFGLYIKKAYERFKAAPASF